MSEDDFEPPSHGGATRSAPAPERWPAPLDSEAYHGVIGDFVRSIQDHVEPDAPPILVQSLVIAGNGMGPGPHRQVAATRHSTAEYAVMVGKTSLSRKGTGADLAIAGVAEAADPSWRDGSLNTSGGLSTGEGLLAALIDPDDETNQDKRDGETKAGRRFLPIESEFGRVLAVRGREGNTLSGWLRVLWDKGEAKNLTKANPIAVRGAHFSLLGHITAAELRDRFDPVDVVNGFGNRVTWTCAKRAAVISDGGPDLAGVFAHHRELIRPRLRAARDLGKVVWSKKADAVYRAAYEILECEPDEDSIATALTSRGPAHVLRYSTIYAALDEQLRGGVAVARVPHLLAALAVVRFGGDSVNCIWGGRSMNPDADRVLTVLRERGSTGLTEIHNAFGRNAGADRLRRALDFLVGRNIIAIEAERTQRPGRPTEMVRLTGEGGVVPLHRPWADALNVARELAEKLGPDDGEPMPSRTLHDEVPPSVDEYEGGHR